MKVFATLATVLGASTATPHPTSNDMTLNQHSMHSVMKPSMGMSMESRISQNDNFDRHMEMSHQISNMRNIYRDNQDMTSNMMDRNIMDQEMSSNMGDMHSQTQTIGPNQYFVKDDLGNYAYSYNDQLSEKSEEGNPKSIKGQYAYIMANGVKRRVEYVADNNGFHVIRDNADPARIKRSTEPDFIQTIMESVMDSSSMRDHASDMYRMSNMMGHDMPSNMDRDLMDIEQQRYSNLMGQDTMGSKMMGRNIYNVMSNRGMISDVSKTMHQQMNSNKMDRDMNMKMMSHNMMGQDRDSQMTGLKMLGQQEITPSTMYSNVMGQDVIMNMSNNRMSSNMMNSRGMSSDMMKSYSNNGIIGQRMMQKMEIEHVPETYTSSRFF